MDLMLVVIVELIGIVIAVLALRLVFKLIKDMFLSFQRISD